MLVTMKEILEHAKEGRYAVAAPNIDNEHNARLCIEAAEELNSPIILGVPYFANPDIEYLGRLVGDLAVRAKVPVAINLDHGSTFEHCVRGIRAGFTSIMVDRSKLPFDENVAEVKELVKIAHAVGVSVEAELGFVGSAENYEVDGYSGLTDPEDARRFVELTGVDCLAVAIGTAHGSYKGDPYIRFELLEEIAAAVPVPLVLHGGSGTGAENLRKCAELGIQKVNLSTELKQEMVDELNRNDITGHGIYGVYKHLGAGYKNKLIENIKILGSEGKAEGWKA